MPAGVGVSPSDTRITARRTRRPRRSSAWNDHLWVADADVDERDLEPALATDARRGGAGHLPLELDPQLVERVARASGWSSSRPTTSTRERPALTAAPSTHRSSSASIGLATTHSPASSWRPENTDTNTIGVEPGPVGPDLPEHLEAVHAGHQHVERDSVEMALAQPLSASWPLGAISRPHVERRELARDQLRDLVLVVDDQHAAAADRLERGRRIEPGTAAGSRTRNTVPRPGSALDGDLAVVEIDQ